MGVTWNCTRTNRAGMLQRRQREVGDGSDCEPLRWLPSDTLPEQAEYWRLDTGDNFWAATLLDQCVGWEEGTWQDAS